jgi:predicted sulfurtransferase
MNNEQINSDSSVDPLDRLMIALYYWYIEIPTGSLNEQVSFHGTACENLNLFGRIRISTEGLNGVLSGNVEDLKEYEKEIKKEIESKFQCKEGEHNQGEDLQYGNFLDVKYCRLRNDIPVETQLFDSLSVKVTKEVVSLNDVRDGDEKNSQKTMKKKRRRRKKNKGERYQQIMEEDRQRKEELQKQYQQQHPHQHQQSQTEKDTTNVLEKEAMLSIDKFEPAPHLTPEEWNEHLLSYSQSNNSIKNQTDGDAIHKIGEQEEQAILIDARNIYESKIGYFSSENVPTLLTNTRKFSTITSTLNESIPHMAGKNVYMYCTGGVRCERASVYLQSLANSESWPDGLERPKSIYQLEGGIQKYLERFGELESKNKIDDQDDGRNEDLPLLSKDVQNCLFKGKNFVFDPRRYDPTMGHSGVPVGKCLVCSIPFDDYDNGHAPCENMEARCCRCRMLILVCDDCRLKVRVWGQEGRGSKDDTVIEEVEKEALIDLFCGPSGNECVNEGNCIDHVEIINT